MYINFTFLFKKNNQNRINSRYFLLVILSLSIFINASSQYLGGNGGGNAMFYLPIAPSAPTNLQVSPANGELFINFTAGSNGGGTITNYKYSLDNGATWIACNPALTASPVNIKYLTNATAYNVQLRAVNAAGDGAVSTAISGTPTLTYLTSLGGVTIVTSGGDAEGSTWFYANKTIMPISSTPINLNVADVLSKLSSDLTIAGSNININTDIVKTSSSKLTLNTPGTINIAANVSTDAAVIYNGVVSTSGARVLTASKLWINGTLTGDNDITLNATNGNVVVMSNVLTTGVFSATASSNTFAMGVDLLNGRGATITADGGVSISASNALLAGKVLTNNTSIHIDGNLQIAHFAATAAPLILDSRNGVINLTGGAVTELTSESVDYALLVANAAKAVTGTNVSISKVVDGSNRYLVYQYTTVGAELFFSPYQVTSSEYIVVAGGGGGGGSNIGSNTGAGGGGGGVADGQIMLAQGNTQELSIGLGGIGGANGTTDGTNGGDSRLVNILTGGGGGGAAVSGSSKNGIGGSFYAAGGGGGGSNANNINKGIGGIGSQRSGGLGGTKPTGESAGGAGGGAVGNANQSAQVYNGTGGLGFVSNITGSSLAYGNGANTYGSMLNVTIPGAGGTSCYALNSSSGAGNGLNGAVILRHFVGNETNHITTYGVSVGHTGNTGDVTNTSTVNLTGPITMHGTNLNINATLTSTASDIHLNAINAATQTAALTSVGLGLYGTGTFTLTNNSNNVVNLAAGTSLIQPAGISFTDASGGLAIGTVGTLTGTISLGNINIETLTGNISVAQNISTSSSSPDAIILNAGKNAAIGTLTGGDVLVVGSRTITMGSGGIAKLFSGDPTTSTGLINLSGGVSNARFLVDETSNAFSPSLSSDNKYALFRGNPPVVSVIGTINPFVVCVGASSSEKVLIVGGSNLSANINITAPTGYEISLTSGSGFTNTITLTAINNAVANTNIYLRLRYDATNGVFGNMSISSTGATTQYKGIPPATIASIPAAPIVTSTINYTTGDIPTILTATALSNHSLKWYSLSTGGTATNTAYTPTTNIAGTQNYYVSQVNASGCESTRAQITVTISNPSNTVQAPAGLSYPSISAITVGNTIATIIPTSNGGAITSYAINPSLPAGLTFNTTTGEITGTPSVAAAQNSYTITATNTAGSTTTTITFAINQAVTNVVLPQGALDATDYGLFAADTVRLKLTTSSGTAPFTLILSNSFDANKDTITNLVPVNNVVVFSQKRLDTSKIFTIFKLIDANSVARTTGFTKDTAVVKILKPLLAMNLTASNPVKQGNGSYLMRLNLVIKNLGDVLLNNVQVDANLFNVFGSNYRFNLSNVKVVSGNARINPVYTGIGAINMSNSNALKEMIQIQSKESNSLNKKSFSILSENYLFDAGTNLNLTEQNEVTFDIIVTPITSTAPLTLQFASSASAVVQKSDGTISSEVASASSNNATNISNHPNVTGIGTPTATVIGFPPNAPVVYSKKYILNNSNNPANLSSLVASIPSGSIAYWCNQNQTVCNTTTPDFPNAIGKYTYIVQSYDTSFQLYSDTVSVTIELVAPTDLLQLQQTIGEPVLQENLTYNVPVTIAINNRTAFPVDSLLVFTDLKSLIPSVVEYKVLSVNTSGGIVPNPFFNGDTQIGLTNNSSSVAGNSTAFIYLLLNINQKSNTSPIPTLSKVKANTYLGVVNIASAPVMENNGVGVPTMIQLPVLGIEIPEVFTPNRDGVNDRFVIIKPYGVRIDLEVYNRWGTKVFTRNNYQNDWDGRGDNAFFGQDLVDGGYYYTIKALNNNGTTQILKGFIIIQR